MSVLDTLASRAIELGLDTLEIEYKDGHEEVFGLKGSLGVGIARFRSGSPDATALREKLHQIAKKRRFVTVGGQVEARVRMFDSFGEAAFRVELRCPAHSPSSMHRRKGHRG